MQPAPQHIPASQPALFFPFRFSTAERDVWRAREDQTISRWAEKTVFVPRGAHIGMYRNEYNPYGVDIMDSYQLPHVREINVCAPPQSTKTISSHVCMAHAIEHDPCEMMIIQPGREDVKEEMEDRIIPMIQHSPELAKYLSDNPDDTAKYHVKLNNGAIIYTAWATSAAKLARKAIKRLFFAEIDKYPDQVGKETDPFNLGEKRKRTFKHTYKIFRDSTPTTPTGPIWRFLNASSVIKHWAVYCPDCGALQIMSRKKGLRYPKDKSPEEIKQSRLARYECEHCHSHWTDAKRDLATRNGHYVVIKGMDIAYPLSIGYHLNGCAVMDISLSEIAAKEIQANSGDEAAAIDLANDYDAEPYQAEKKERQEDAILELIDPHQPRLIVPRNISGIMIYADTQQIGVHYEVWAVGHGRSPDIWIIDNGFLLEFDHLAQLQHTSWEDASGRHHVAFAGFIDSGGGTNPAKPKHSRTREVYDLCIANPFWNPVKGRQVMSTPWNVTRIEYYPSRDGKKVAIPGGLNLYTLNVTYYKNDLANRLAVTANRPAAFHLHNGLTKDELDAGVTLEEGRKRWEDYAKQMCAEYKDDRGYWICPPGKANHHWDISVYGLAGLDITRIAETGKQSPEEPQQHQQTVIAAAQITRPAAPALPGWFRNRR